MQVLPHLPQQAHQVVVHSVGDSDFTLLRSSKVLSMTWECESYRLEEQSDNRMEKLSSCVQGASCLACLGKGQPSCTEAAATRRTEAVIS